MEPHDFIRTQVRAAGELLMRLREEKFETLGKGGDPRDVVTSVDLAVNDFLIGKIREAFPNDSIYSEEKGADAVRTAPRLWALDPIDGSSNFSRGIPHFSICVAFLANGVPEAGGVYNPVTNEFFSFKRGSGAFLNDKPIQVSKETELKNSFVLLHAGRKEELREWGGKAYRQLLEHAKKTSNLAGSALDTCFVAAGRVEASIYGTGSLLDIAAAVGILTEAGGIIVNERGELSSLLAAPQRIIAANSIAMADALRTIL
jgi:myo-inositol-1(or 4)-monophosphatase